jgi:hypothetical protein
MKCTYVNDNPWILEIGNVTPPKRTFSTVEYFEKGTSEVRLSMIQDGRRKLEIPNIHLSLHAVSLL